MSTEPTYGNAIQVKNTGKQKCRLDEIMLDMKAQGKKYADWQAERYPILADLPRRRMR